MPCTWRGLGEAAGAAWAEVESCLGTIQGGLEAGQVSDQPSDKIFDQLQLLGKLHNDSPWPTADHASVPAPPRLREALLSVSAQMLRTNAALLPALEALLEPQGHHLRPDCAAVLTAARALLSAATQIQYSTKVYMQHSHTDNLKQRICEASVAILESGARLYDIAAAGDIAVTVSASTGATQGTLRVGNYRSVMREYGEGLAHTADYLDGMRASGCLGGLQDLRTTTHPPAAILAALRRILRDAPSKDEQVDSIAGLYFIKIILSANTEFGPERRAMTADPRLLNATLAHLEAGVRCFVGRARAPGPRGAPAYNDVLNAVQSMTYLLFLPAGRPGIESVIYERANSSAEFLELMASISDACLQGPPEEVAADPHSLGFLWGRTLLSGLNLLDRVLRIGRPRAVLAMAVASLLRRAVVAVAALLRMKAPRELLEGGAGGLAAIMELLDALVGGGHPGGQRLTRDYLDTVMRGQCDELWRSLEGLVRLATQTAGFAGSRVEYGMVTAKTAALLGLLGGTGNWVELLPPPGGASPLLQYLMPRGYGLAAEVTRHREQLAARGIDSPAALSILPMLDHSSGTGGWRELFGGRAGLEDATGLVDSLAKCGLHLAARGSRSPATLSAARLAASAMLLAAPFIHDFGAHLRAEAQDLALRSTALRRWQALALSVSSAVVTVAGLRGGAAEVLSRPMQALLFSLAVWPEACTLSAATPTGGAALVSMYKALLANGELFDRLVVRSTFRALAQTDPGCQDNAAALARLGILNLMARAAELHTGGTGAEAFDAEVISAWFSIIEMAAQRSGAEAVEACRRLAAKHGPDPQRKAAFWKEVQEDVAPLVKKGAAAPSGVPVEVAEALSTRRCAHLGCTDVAGPSEAGAPRGKRCGTCQAVRYCSRACQAADWKAAHRAVCPELAARRSAAGPRSR